MLWLEKYAVKFPPISEIGSALDNNKLRKESNIKKCIGYMLAAAGFAVFFGGTFLDGLVSSIIGIVIFGMDHFFQIRKLNRVIYTVIACFFIRLPCSIMWPFWTLYECG